MSNKGCAYETALFSINSTSALCPVAYSHSGFGNVIAWRPQHSSRFIWSQTEFSEIMGEGQDKTTAYITKEYGPTDALSLVNEAKQKRRKIFFFPHGLRSEFVNLLFGSQPFSTYKKLVQGGVSVPDLLICSCWVKWPCPFTWEPPGRTESQLWYLVSWAWAGRVVPVSVLMLQEMEQVTKRLLWLMG